MLNKLIRKIGNGIHKYIVLPSLKQELAHCGKDVYIGKNADLTLNNIYVGNRVYMGPDMRIMSTRANVYIGNDVMFGPAVTIITGNHKIDVIGRTMNSIKEEEKDINNDQDVVIEDDVWIGANVIILKGVTIKKGSVIAAGSVVVNSVPEYTIVGGIPAKKIKMRFTDEEIEKHKEIMKIKEIY